MPVCLELAWVAPQVDKAIPGLFCSYLMQCCKIVKPQNTNSLLLGGGCPANLVFPYFSWCWSQARFYPARKGLLLVP